MAASAASFAESVSVAYDQDVTLAYSTRDGSATAGSDYVATSGTVTFALTRKKL